VTLIRIGSVGGLSDVELLERFVSGRDEAGEANFRALVARHGPMVLRVCRCVLNNPDDAKDAFQVTFLSPDGKRLLSAFEDATALVWDMAALIGGEDSSPLQVRASIDR
jgi:Sigma-70 region 2